MKVLLDTNIIIYREASRGINPEIGQLFNWFDKLKLEKYIHPITIEEVKGHNDPKIVKAFKIKLESYNIIKYPLPFSDDIDKASRKFDINGNDINDTQLLNELYEGQVDILITEDKKIHQKAAFVGISEKVFKIRTFLEKVTAENPNLINYNVLAVKLVDFGEVNIKDSFFNSFRNDYNEFDNWFIKKLERQCYVCYSDEQLTAFLHIKVEDAGSENYSDISPVFTNKKRLKIATLKVISNGYKIGERFLKIVFDHARENKVEEIYVTIFEYRSEQLDLIEMLKTWGFVKHGVKTSKNGEEVVLVRTFGKQLPVSIENPKFTFPFLSRQTRKYIIKIRPEYHTELFPDSITSREDPTIYTDNAPHRNRIGKVYISHSQDRHLQTGDVILIYRMGETSPKRYSSTITSICIVEEVIKKFDGFDDFYNTCVRRTLLEKNILRKWWNRNPKNRPFVVKFLYAHSLPTPKPTLNDLNSIGVIPDIYDMPRGFIEINTKQFNDLINFAYFNKK